MLMIMMMLHFRNAINFICESYAQANTLRCLGLEAGRSRLSISPFSESLCPFRCLRLNRSLSFMWGGGVVKESPDEK